MVDLLQQIIPFESGVPLLRLVDLHYQLQAFQSTLVNCRSNDLQFRILFAILYPQTAFYVVPNLNQIVNILSDTNVLS